MNSNFIEIFPIMMIGIMVFPLFWGGVVTLISYISGWQSLAGFYASDEQAIHETRRWRSLSMRRKSVPSNYSGVITYGISDAALFISVMILFRIGHKPLRIPFADLAIEKGRGVLGREANLTVTQVPGLTLILSMTDVEWIESLYADLSGS